MKKRKPNFLVILIDDLRYDEFGAGGHPYMKTPNIDRIAHEGALFTRAFHTTPICSPNRASVMSGQYASRHGVIDNVARDAMRHRLPNYHLELQQLGYETAHIGKWHMGNDGKPRPGYDHWISYDGHGRLNDPVLNKNGRYSAHKGYMTDIMNDYAVDYLKRKRTKPFSLFYAHKAVHPDADQAADGKLTILPNGGYIVPKRHQGLYKNDVFPSTPNMLSAEEVVKNKPAWKECLELKKKPAAKTLLKALQAGTQQEIRLRAQMMASVDEGVGRILQTLDEQGELDNTCIIFFGDNGYFFGEHGLGPERRFAYEEGIRSPFAVRYPPMIPSGSNRSQLVICQDIAPTLIELAGGQPGQHIQGQSMVPVFQSAKAKHRKSFMVEYWAENAMPWLVGMTYKAIRTQRYKYIHWVNRGQAGELDELYDLKEDPYELKNLCQDPVFAAQRRKLQKSLRGLVNQALGLAAK